MAVGRVLLYSAIDYSRAALFPVRSPVMGAALVAQYEAEVSVTVMRAVARIAEWPAAPAPASVAAMEHVVVASVAYSDVAASVVGSNTQQALAAAKQDAALVERVQSRLRRFRTSPRQLPWRRFPGASVRPVWLPRGMQHFH